MNNYQSQGISLNRPGQFNHLDQQFLLGKGAPVKGGAPVQAPTDKKPTVAVPPDDTGRTWGSPTSPRDLNFGHYPVHGELFSLHESGRPVWADNGRALTADQWANMPKAQQDKIRGLVGKTGAPALTAFDKAMQGGVADRAKTTPRFYDNLQLSPFAQSCTEASSSVASVADRARAAKAAGNREILLNNLSTRLDDLNSERQNLGKDLNDPNKQAEARARIGLIDVQSAQLHQVYDRVKAYQVPSGLNAHDSQTVDNALGDLNGFVKDLSDPQKRVAALGSMTQAFNLLRNPSLDANDPAIQSQVAAARSVAQHVQDLVDASNDLIGDLGDPRKKAEAQARLGQINQQLGEVGRIQGHLDTYTRPGNLTADQDQHLAGVFAEIAKTAKDLGDPIRHDEAKARLGQLWQQLPH